MELIFYSARTDDFSSSLLDQVGSLIPVKNLVVCRNLKQLREALFRPAYELFAAILVAAGSQDLLNIVSMAEFLHSIRVILILPDRERDSILIGHALRPRFLTSSACNPNEIVAVARKMLENAEKYRNM